MKRLRFAGGELRSERTGLSYVCHFYLNGFKASLYAPDGKFGQEGQTCQAIIEPVQPQPPDTFEQILEEVVPMTQRGAKIRSIGLSSNATGMASTEYERMRIIVTMTAKGASAATKAQSVIGNVASATVHWTGVVHIEKSIRRVFRSKDWKLELGKQDAG